jgi:tRNA threonylcarbamoyladenosine biosynthesis protein TsaB
LKSLAIDSAVTKIFIAAKNDDKTVTVILDIGMKQSESLLPAVDSVLQRAGITVSELDYAVLCNGPGSFTGLRLGFSALKAINMAYGVPLYGVSTLLTYQHPFSSLPYTLLSVMDAKKDHFFAAAYEHGTQIIPDGEYAPDQLAKQLPETVFVCGMDAEVFIRRMEGTGKTFITIPFQPVTTDSLFDIAEQMIARNEPPLKDFDGPVYLRASEAEEALAARG